MLKWRNWLQAIVTLTPQSIWSGRSLAGDSITASTPGLPSAASRQVEAYVGDAAAGILRVIPGSASRPARAVSKSSHCSMKLQAFTGFPST